MGVLGKEFMTEKQSNFLGESTPEKMTWAAKSRIDWWTEFEKVEMEERQTPGFQMEVMLQTEAQR